jgi:type IV pilus assembly protein PilX
MKSLPNRIVRQCGYAARQRGVVLFFALIALVVMSLAAVALIRSVDTSTMIAGNLAFKQSATASGDSGLEAAITALTADQVAMKAANNNVLSNTTNTFNVDNAANGYYSNANPALDLTDPANWVNASSMLVGTDVSGNEVRYIIQRMCRTANRLPNQTEETALVPPKTACLFSAAALDNNGQQVPLPSDICQGAGCPAAGQSPEYRITSRTAGPGNTVSYVQAFVY